MVAIDGVDGSGKSHFAKELAKVLWLIFKNRKIVVSIVDNFHNLKAIRYQKGRESGEGFYNDSYNYIELKKLLVEPFKLRKGFYESAI